MSTPSEQAPYVLEGIGRIDASIASQLDEQLKALHAAGVRVLILDLSKVTYLSSSGLRVLLLALRRQEASGGRFVLRNVPERIMRVLRIAGFDRLFPIEGDPALTSETHDA